jgi:hypothetical protein
MQSRPRTARLDTSVSLSPSSGQTVIDIGYDTFETRTRPCCSTNSKTHQEINVVLSPGNNIKETFTISYEDSNFVGGRFSKTYEAYDGQIGKEGNISDQIWHVMSDNSLFFGQDFPQSTRTKQIIVISDKKCKFIAKDKLKSGFTEYAFPLAKTNELAYFSDYKDRNFTCSIHTK